MAVTPATLKEIFPDFAGVADTVMAYWLDRALRVTSGWDDDHATMLLAAHYMTINGIGAGADMTTLSGLSSVKSGSVSLTFQEDRAQGQGDWNRSSYGVQFRTLLAARTHALPMVTGGTELG